MRLLPRYSRRKTSNGQLRKLRLRLSNAAHSRRIARRTK